MYINITQKILSNYNFLKLIYNLIKNKKNNVFMNSKKLTLKWFKKMSLTIKNDTFRLKKKFNIYVSRKKNINKISIIINSPHEQIIQKAIYLILEEIYENKDIAFAEFSYVFRPTRNLRCVFWIVKQKWISVNWFVKVCARNIFSSSNFTILISRLKLKIRDKRLNNIILRMLKANIIFISGISKENVSISLNNILSQILTNVYFQGLDNEIKKNFIIKYNLNKKTVKSSFCYEVLRGSITRVNYIRYADNILISVQDFKFLAIKILNALWTYLKLNLRLLLDIKKTQILNLCFNKILFLGMLISNVYFKNLSIYKTRKIKNKKRARLRYLSRVSVCNWKHFKSFKNKLSDCVEKVPYKSSNNRHEKKNLQFLVESWQIFICNFFYGYFWKNFQEVLVIKQSEELFNLAKSFGEEHLNFKGNLSNKTLQAAVKKSMIKKIVLFLIANYNLQVQTVKWSQLFKSINKNKVIFKSIWLENFKLSEYIVFILKKLCKKKFTEWVNKKIICLAIKDLFNKIKSLGIKSKVKIALYKVFEDTCWNLNIVNARKKFSIKVNADIVEVYKYLMKVSIINKKKKPVSKALIVKLKPFLIVNYFNKVAKTLLFYFRCTDNFHIIQKVIVCNIRYSLLYTLAQKYKCSLTSITVIYDKEI